MFRFDEGWKPLDNTRNTAEALAFVLIVIAIIFSFFDLIKLVISSVQRVIDLEPSKVKRRELKELLVDNPKRFVKHYHRCVADITTAS